VELSVLAPELFSPLHRLVLESYGDAVDWAVGGAVHIYPGGGSALDVGLWHLMGTVKLMK